MRTLLVSLDQVLVTKDFEEARPSPRAEIFQVATGVGRPRTYLLRPHTRRFLADVRRFFQRIYLVDYMSFEEIGGILEAADLSVFFHGIYCGDDLLPVESQLSSKDFLTATGDAVDNEVGLLDVGDWRSTQVRAKLALFGHPVGQIIAQERRGEEISEENLITEQLMPVTSFRGDPEDDYLLEVLAAFDYAAANPTGV